MRRLRGGGGGVRRAGDPGCADSWDGGAPPRGVAGAPTRGVVRTACSSTYTRTVPVRVPSVILLLLVFLALAGAPPALARSENATATRTYLQANHAFVRAARSNLAAGNAALRSLVRQLTGECPLAAAESPQNHESEQLNDEVVGAITIVAFRPDAAAAGVFAHAVGGLRWSSRVLTRKVRTYAAQLEGLAKLAVPDVCADVRAWAADGYRSLPASTQQFNQRYDEVDIEAEEIPQRLLAPHESAAELSLARRTQQLEAPIADAEADAVGDYTRILDALELNQ